MSQSQCRCLLFLLLIAILPVSLSGQDSGAAMLHHTGGVLLNRSSAPLSSAIFPGDVVETPTNTSASITLAGSRITINSETIVQFEGDEILLEHGNVFVETSQSFRVRAACVLAVPAVPDFTQYEVTDRDGKVTVYAYKRDVNIDSRSSNHREAKTGKSDQVSVHEGEQKSREDKCGAGIIQTASAGAKNGILNSSWAKWAGIGTVGTIACVALCRSDDPVSPSGFSH